MILILIKKVIKKGMTYFIKKQLCINNNVM